MAPVIRIDDELMNELKKRAVDLNMVFSTPNDVLKVALGLTTTDENPPRPRINPMAPQTASVTFPQSNDPYVQKLIDGLRNVILSLSNSEIGSHSKSGRWVASPNFMTIKVQDKRVRNLALTVYGNPQEFDNLRHNLDIKADQNSYSRFKVDREDQLQSAIEVIRYAYHLYLERNPRRPR